MKRPITLAVDQQQYGRLHHAIIERIYQNENELYARYIHPDTAKRIEEENVQLENLLKQLETEYNHVFK